ncbi:hypothetical protein DFJ43DRAFT_1009224 [Lentinula guzmanii]|uniref:Uncharacterized protein n=1 Tax=Lentinula guzmanii TaxID=2804957 RepID=A0AA38MUA5_9AGAR|nr:hypothetical protein DFJ43DRAFT_1009224 [Lentinula guzmanii]
MSSYRLYVSDFADVTVTFRNKAVADGALSYYLDHFVSARVARLTYGTDCARPYNPSNIEHMRRRHTMSTRPSGKQVIPNAFSTIISKGVLVHEETEFKEHYVLESSIRSAYNHVSADIMVYRGRSSCPEWTDVEPRMFSTWCTVYADLSHVVEISGIRDGRMYFNADFEVVILFGGPEIKAQVSWRENVSLLYPSKIDLCPDNLSGERKEVGLPTLFL